MRRWRWAILVVVLMLHAAALAALRAAPSVPAPVVVPPVLLVSLPAETTTALATTALATTALAPAKPTPAKPTPVKTAPVKTTPWPKPVSRPAQPAPDRTNSAQADAAPAAETPPGGGPGPQAPGAPPPSPSVREPTAISCRPPAYPPEARRKRETGTVLLRLLVDADGTVTERRIEQSSGSELLDQAALTALSRCKFTPGMIDGRPQDAWARLRYVWKLE